ncbi:beta-galactosidase [Wenyingzhuangia heitensis]|uniref:Beta-galactosidase n=1 Tax=Wenyingzhuangia heitensis TaxID=1487859 RepID=A0ABX0UFZ3_9FLAO|nr:glycoside hydrolase family 2 TIM barrel-domain containing protein [Wenyingzhuangia heitensis]NIJ45932.1 beta-galactosidase [Wenyingzhuangia heitensis]
MKMYSYKKSKSLIKGITLLVFALLLGCKSVVKKDDIVPEEAYSLNGNWKFNTIYGQGHNYLNVVEKSENIIIDNDDKKHVEIKGNWKKSKKENKGATFYKKDYLVKNFKAGESKDNYVRFHPYFKKSGYYEAFITHPYASHNKALYTVKHKNGESSKKVSSRTFCNEWISLGIFQFDNKDDNYIEITATTEGQVPADAVMFQSISKEAFEEAQDLPSKIFLPSHDDSKWHNLKVPGHWGMINSYSNYTGIGWYRKTFELPSHWSQQKDERVRIQFGAVYHLAKVYLNGKLVGEHRGGLTPFELDITDYVKFGDKNVIAVEVNNDFIVGATWNWGGIIRDVTIKKDKDVRIQLQYIHADPDLEKGTATIDLKVRLENNSNKTRTIDVLSKIKEIADVTLSQEGVEVAANSTKTIVLKGSLKAKDVKLWHFDAPHLYTLQTTISDASGSLDSKFDDFGIRKIELTKSQMLLNGEPIRTGGFNRVSENRYFGSSEPLEILERDIDLMKASGANFMRIMHGTQNEKLIELCDRKGILLFEEVNVRHLENAEFTAPEYPLIKSWLKEMVERDLNHPSIIGWSVGNELKLHYDYAKNMMDYVRTELDEHRLLTCVSNSGQKQAYTPETDPNTHVDIIMHNMYRWQGQPQEILNTLREKWPNKPVFISEYGFDPYPTASLDGDKPIVSEWNQHYRGKNEFVIGTSMWTFNDYRSSYGGTSAEENRVWGVINVWGQKRRLFDRFQKENSPIKILNLGEIDLSKKSTSIEITTKETSNYPSYTLKDYKLVYTFSSEKGDVLLEKEVALPTLHPGASWSGKIDWETLNNPYLLKVKIVNPLGYERGKKETFFKVPNTPTIKEVISGNKGVRVYFDKAYGVKEYVAAYKTKTGAYQYTQPTISNFIDIDSLSNSPFQVSLTAVNSKGKSTPSEEVTVTLGNKLLPPVIWHSFMDDQKLVIGYSSDFEDENYTVAYGTNKENLENKMTSNVRGMMTIDLNESVKSPIYIKIKREVAGKSSEWSNTVEIGLKSVE